MSRASERKAMAETLASWSMLHVDQVAGLLNVEPKEALRLIHTRKIPSFAVGDPQRMVNIRIDPIDACAYKLATERGTDPAELYRALMQDEASEEDWAAIRAIYQSRPRTVPLEESIRAGLVYLIEMAEPPHRVKVGFSENVPRRLNDLQNASPVQLRVRATWPGTMEDERRLHKQLAEHRLHGEWFAPDAATLAERLMEDRT